MPILRTVAMLVVLAMLALPASGRAARSQPSLLASVRPLSMTMTVYMDPETHIQFSLNVCTASSINAVTHLWLTAAHCVQHLEPNEAGIPIAVQGKVEYYTPFAGLFPESFAGVNPMGDSRGAKSINC